MWGGGSSTPALAVQAPPTSAVPQRTPAARWIDVSIAAVLFLIGAVLRWIELRQHVLWVDEISSAGYAGQSVSVMLHNVITTDNHPPLYYLVVHIEYVSLHMGTIDALRVPSIIAGAGSVALTFALGRVLVGRIAGIVAATIALLSPVAMWYSDEGRMYSLLWCLLLLACLAFVRAVASDGRERWLIVLALSVAAALYTDLTAAMTLVPLGMVVVWRLARTYWPRRSAPVAQRQLWLKIAGAYGVGCLIFAPWLITLPSQASVAGGHSYAPTWQIAWTFISSIAGSSAPYAYLGATVGSITLVLLLGGYLCACLVTAETFLLAQSRRYACFRLIVAVLTAGPAALTLLLIVVGYTSVLIGPRTVGMAVFGLALMAGGAVEIIWHTTLGYRQQLGNPGRGSSLRGLGASAVGPAVALLLAAVVIASTGAGLVTVETRGVSGEFWDRIAYVIQQNAQPGDEVIYLPYGPKPGVDAYLPADSPWKQDAHGVWSGTDAQIEADLAQWIPGHQGLWIVYYGSMLSHAPVYTQWLRAHGYCQVPVPDPWVRAHFGTTYHKMGVLEYRYCAPLKA